MNHVFVAVNHFVYGEAAFDFATAGGPINSVDLFDSG